jgi:hypothetical protein
LIFLITDLSLIVWHDLALTFDIFIQLMCQFKVFFAWQVYFVDVVKVSRSLDSLLDLLLLYLLFELRLHTLVFSSRSNNT